MRPIIRSLKAFNANCPVREEKLLLNLELNEKAKISSVNHLSPHDFTRIHLLPDPYHSEDIAK
jgi:hypothetical protein